MADLERRAGKPASNRSEQEPDGARAEGSGGEAGQAGGRESADEPTTDAAEHAAAAETGGKTPAAYHSVSAYLVRGLVFVAALAALEVYWLRTGRAAILAALAAALALLLAASIVAWPRWWWRALTGVRMAIALLILITGACAVGTVIVQDADRESSAPGADRLDEFVRRQGAFFWRIGHRTPRIDLKPEERGYFNALAERFGHQYALGERRDYVRARRAQARSEAAGAWLGRHDAHLRAFHRVLWAVRLSNVYRCWWFAGLLGALAVNLAVCSVRRLRLTWRRLGLIVMHAGVVIVLVGAALSRLTKQQGAIPVAPGMRSDRYERAADGAKITLDFSLALHDFRTEYRKELICWFPGPGGSRLERSFPVEPGEAIRLGPEPADGQARDAYTVTVEEFLPRSWPADTVEELSGDPIRPAVEMIFSRPNAPDAVHWLSAEPGDYAIAEDRSYLVRFRGAGTAEGYQARLRETESETPGLLTLRLVRFGEVFDANLLVVEPEQSALVDLGGKLFHVRVLDVIPDLLAVVSVPTRPHVYRPHPVVRIQVTDPLGQPENHIVFQAAEFQDLQRRRPDEQFQARYVTDAPPMPLERYLLVSAPGQSAVLVGTVGGRRLEPVALQPGQPVRVPGTDTTVTLGRVVGQALFPLVSDHHQTKPDSSRFPPRAHPGVRLRVDGPMGPDIVWLRAAPGGRSAATYRDGQLHLEYRDRLETTPLDYRALVAVYEDGRQSLEQEVEVNRPLKYRGYLFYQVDAEYGQMMVVRDPSLPIVYGGLVLLLVGAVAHFLIIPPLR